MANIVQVVKIHEGMLGMVLQVYLESDGVSGELDGVVLADPADGFDPTQSALPSIKIQEVQHDLKGFSAVLSFDDLVDGTPTWVMTDNGSAKACFRHVGGLFDRSSTLDGSGKLLLSTRGFDTAGAVGSFLITLRKS